MPASSEFVPFATDPAARVLSQAVFIAQPEVALGFDTGPAVKEFLNKVWRQSSVVASAFTQWLATQLNQNVLDDGDVAGLVTQIGHALSGGLRTLRVVVIDTAVLATDGVIEVNAAGAPITVTFDPTLGVGLLVRIVKSDVTANAVNINDLSGTVASFNTAAVGAVMASRSVYSDGANLRVLSS